MATTEALNDEGVRKAEILDLGDGRATDPQLAGAKASNLARGQGQGFPVLPGFVITTGSGGRNALQEPAFILELGRRYQALTRGGTRRVVVRSSSVAEDGTESSMAGMFRSVTDVATWNEFLGAIEDVYESAVTPLRHEPAPMAVLVQLQLEPVVGGVMFGIDPVSGRRDRIVIAAVTGSPETLVSGNADGTNYTLTPRGRTIERVDGSQAVELLPFKLKRLAALARRAAEVFGGPQDVEWAYDREGSLWMLQSRPVTAAADSSQPTGPVLGPGPVAETFPDPLAPLERDLWLEPFREGLTAALAIAGMQSRKRLDSSPVVVTVGGRAAVDLELLGIRLKRASVLSILDPRPRLRRLAASWRVGRLRAALPDLAEDLLERVYDELASVGALPEHEDKDLLVLLHRSRHLLVSLHGHEALAGMLLPRKARASSAASMALRVLGEARSQCANEQHIAACYPELLALFPPAIGSLPKLPPTPAEPPPEVQDPEPLAASREALRLAARIVQELSGRASLELGRRALRRGTLTRPEDIKSLRLQELDAVMVGDLVPLDLHDANEKEVPPLPDAFRLTSAGTVVAERPAVAGEGGRGAGGGRAMGSVRAGADDVRPGDVLVVRTLDPRLAGALPVLGGLVAETGSVLSHLAILAREFGVPTVVGVSGAVDRFPPGSVVVVDGLKGEVSLVDEDEAAR